MISVVIQISLKNYSLEQLKLEYGISAYLHKRLLTYWLPNTMTQTVTVFAPLLVDSSLSYNCHFFFVFTYILTIGGS